jgi:endoglucanase
MGVDPQDSLIKPYFCTQDRDGRVTKTIAPGETVNGSQYSHNPFYIGGALRFGGCSENNSYLGYLGLSILAVVVKEIALTEPWC